MNKSLLFFASISFLLFAPVAEAQMYMSAGANVYAGGGAYFGQNNCSGGVNIPPSILDKNSDVQDTKKDIEDIKRSVNRDKKDLREAKRKYDYDDSVVCSWFRSTGNHNVCGALRNWFTKNDQGKDLNCQGASQAGVPWKDYCSDLTSSDHNVETAASAAQSRWTTLNASNGSDNFPDAHGFCTEDGLIKAQSQKIAQEPNSVHSSYRWSKYLSKGSGSYSEQNCEDALNNYNTDYGAYKDAQSKLAMDQGALNGAKEALKQARRDRSDAVDRYAENAADGNTSAQICWSCLNGHVSQGPSTLDRVLPLVGSVLGMGFTYAGMKYAADQNAKLGWPTNPWMWYEAGAPFAMAGIYGAINGGGCSMGGPGGAFGYPGGYYSPYGGGMSPYMMNPYGIGPGMGFGMGAGMGMGMGPYGAMMPGMMGPPGMMSPYGMMGGMPGMMGMAGVGVGMGMYNPYASMMGYMSPGYGMMTPTMMGMPGMMGQKAPEWG